VTIALCDIVFNKYLSNYWAASSAFPRAATHSTDYRSSTRILQQPSTLARC